MTVTGDQPGERPMRMVERALGWSPVTVTTGRGRGGVAGRTGGAGGTAAAGTALAVA